MDALNEMEQGSSSPLLSDDGVPVVGLVCLRGQYKNLGQVAHDMKGLVGCLESVKGALDMVLGEKVVLEQRVNLQARWIMALERHCHKW